MLAHANIGEVNFSKNPTYIQSGSTAIRHSGAIAYVENDERTIKNIASSSFADVPGDYEKQVYISKVAIC